MWASQLRANLLYKGRKREREQNQPVTQSPAKRAPHKYKDQVVKLGVEIETCLDAEKFSDLVGSYENQIGMFIYEDDSSIKCRSPYEAREFVSREEVEFDIDSSNSGQRPSYKQMIQDIHTILSISSACSNNSCGTHVHMSLPNYSVNEHPFLFVILQSEWIKTYQKESIATHKTRDSSTYAQVQTEINNRNDLNKYTTMNLLPIFVTKVRDERYIDREEEELEYHIEFRGQRDAMEAYANKQTRSGIVFDIDAFNKYIRFLATFMHHCKNIPAAMYDIEYADLSNLRLTRVSDHFYDDITTCNIKRLDLSNNKFNATSLGKILKAATDSKLVELHLGFIPNVVWDPLLDVLKKAIDKLQICSIDRAQWTHDSNKNEIIAYAMQKKTSLVNVSEDNLVGTDSLTSHDYLSTAIHAPMSLLLFRYTSQDVKHVPELLQQGNGIQKLVLDEGDISEKKYGSHMSLLLELEHHTIKGASITAKIDPITNVELVSIQTFLNHHKKHLEALLLDINDTNFTSEQANALCNTVLELENLESFHTPRRSIGIVNALVMLNKTKATRATQIHMKKLNITDACTPLFAHQLSQMTDLKIIDLEMDNKTENKSKIISILVAFKSQSNLKRFTILPYAKEYTHEAVYALLTSPSETKTNLLEEVFEKFPITNLSSYDSEVLSLTCENFPIFLDEKGEAMLQLLCHNMSAATSIKILEMDGLVFSGSQLKRIAKAIEGKPIREIWLNRVGDQDTGTITGVLAFFEVLKTSTAEKKEFTVNKLGFIMQALMDVLPPNTTREDLGQNITFHLR